MRLRVHERPAMTDALLLLLALGVLICPLALAAWLVRRQSRRNDRQPPQS